MRDPLARLLDLAAPQHGLFTLVQASEVDVVDAQVRQMAARGVLERRSAGVYRITTMPFDAYTESMEAVLWAKGRAVIAAESALFLWDLADVNPRKVHLISPPGYRPRRAGGEFYQVRHATLDGNEVDEVQGVPLVTSAVAIRQSIDAWVPGDMCEQAIGRGQARELIGAETAARLSVRLYDRSTVKGTA